MWRDWGAITVLASFFCDAPGTVERSSFLPVLDANTYTQPTLIPLPYHHTTHRTLRQTGDTACISPLMSSRTKKTTLAQLREEKNQRELDLLRGRELIEDVAAAHGRLQSEGAENLYNRLRPSRPPAYSSTTPMTPPIAACFS